jgi:hypothetical protein
MKKSIFPKKIAVFIAIFMILPVLAACGESERSFMSTNRLAANETDQTVVSIMLDVADDPLDYPIEILDAPLEPGEVHAVFFSLPEKQAKKSSWEVWCVLEDGTMSETLNVGNINPHGDGSRLTCFSVAWNDHSDSPMMRLYFDDSEADYGIYDPGDATWGTIEGYFDDEDDYSDDDYDYYEEDYSSEDDYAIDQYDALANLNSVVEYYGWNPDDLELTEYYGEPTSVWTEDYSEYVDAWIFKDDSDVEGPLFYAVDMYGISYVYDMTNGALISFETYFANN